MGAPLGGGGAGEASAELLRGSERVAPCARSGAGGGGAASAAPRASVSVIPSCRQGCRREANPTQTPCSGDVPTTCSGDVLATFQWPLERRQNVAGTGCWNVAGTVENRHSPARAQGALRALRPRGGGGHPLQRILAPLWAWGTNNHWGFLGFPLPLDNKGSYALYGHGARTITGGSWVFPSPEQQRFLAPVGAWGTNNHWGFLGFPLPLDNKDS